MLSVIIPALDEGPRLAALLRDLLPLGPAAEVIVVDGGSRDDTVAVARERGARVILSEGGRGPQLRAGAAIAAGDLYCFLHADLRLPPATVDRLSALIRDPPGEAVAFRFCIDGRSAGYRVIEWGTNLRSAWLGLPYGDQGLVVGRAAYEACGGYPPIPLMEDVALVRQLRASVGIRLLREPVLVSPRRWERDGAFRRTVRNWSLLARYLTGADPRVLAHSYRAEGRSED